MVEVDLVMEKYPPNHKKKKKKKKLHLQSWHVKQKIV